MQDHTFLTKIFPKEILVERQRNNLWTERIKPKTHKQFLLLPQRPLRKLAEMQKGDG